MITNNTKKHYYYSSITMYYSQGNLSKIAWNAILFFADDDDGFISSS